MVRRRSSETCWPRAPAGPMPLVLRAAGPGKFEAIGQDTDVTFERQGGRTVRMVVKRHGMEASLFGRVEPRKERKPTPGRADEPAAAVAAPGNWPSFRGA